MIFLQYWYWYPFLNFISLSLSPTAVIGVNKNLVMPNYKIKSNARPSLYSVPAQVKAPKVSFFILALLPSVLLPNPSDLFLSPLLQYLLTSSKEVVLKALPTAQLSITKKQMLRESKRRKEQGKEEGM